MLRLSIARVARPAARSFTTTTRVMAGGDTGAPRSTGSGDAFTKREKANEDYTIRKREKEKLLELKAKLAEQRSHLTKLEEHIDELERQKDEASDPSQK